MRIITINVNGIRAAERKGFFDWLKKQNADVVCLQEIKAQEDQLDDRFYPDDMHTFYHSAERKGYSGQASTADQSRIGFLLVRGMTWTQRVELFRPTLVTSA